MTFSLYRHIGDPIPEEPVITTFDTLAELFADVRANDGLSDNEFYEFVRLGSFNRTGRVITFSENG